MAEKARYNIYLWHHTNLLPLIRFPHFSLREMKQKQPQNASYLQSQSIRLYKNKNNRLKIIPGNTWNQETASLERNKTKQAISIPFQTPWVTQICDQLIFILTCSLFRMVQTNANSWYHSYTSYNRLKASQSTHYIPKCSLLLTTKPIINSFLLEICS